MKLRKRLLCNYTSVVINIYTQVFKIFNVFIAYSTTIYNETNLFIVLSFGNRCKLHIFMGCLMLDLVGWRFKVKNLLIYKYIKSRYLAYVHLWTKIWKKILFDHHVLNIIHISGELNIVHQRIMGYKKNIIIKY